MLKIAPFQLAALSLAACAWAETPLASVLSREPFELNGSTVRTAGVPSWPVAPGDVITTHGAPATLVFRDGSRITVSSDSKGKVETRGATPVFRLLEGSGRYTLPARPSLTLLVTDKPVATKPSTGGFISSNPEPAPATRSATAAAVTDKDPDKDKPPHPSPHK